MIIITRRNKLVQNTRAQNKYEVSTDKNGPIAKRTHIAISCTVIVIGKKERQVYKTDYKVRKRQRKKLIL